MKKIAIGSMVALSLYSALVYADQVINDDLIVTFSTCTGNDCVNGESFGFDTLRLKENNLRINFQDTSTSASFPTNDWRIVANDSSNGGANYLAIEDSSAGRIPFRVEAAAPANSLVVEADGDVGIGTLDPVVNIHNVEGNTPTLRLEQDGSSGFTPQTWDIAGNEANFFIRDVTNGSKLPFKIKPGAPTSSIFVAADGDVGIGTESLPTHASIQTTLMIEGTSNDHSGITFNSPDASTVSSLTFTKAGTPQWFLSSRNDFDADKFIFYGNAVTPIFSLLQDGKIGFGLASVNSANAIEHSNGARLTTGGVWTDASSRQLKDNIVNISTEIAFKALQNLNPVTFNYKNDPEESYAGFIAEDVPEVVATNDRKGLAPMDIVAVLTKVVQQQNETIEKLTERVSELEKKKN